VSVVVKRIKNRKEIDIYERRNNTQKHIQKNRKHKTENIKNKKTTIKRILKT